MDYTYETLKQAMERLAMRVSVLDERVKRLEQQEETPPKNPDADIGENHQD